MRLQIKLRLLDEDGTEVSEDQLLDLDKTADHVEAVGLSLSEAKELLNGIQTRLVIAQAADHARRHRCCPDCGRPRRVKGSSPLVFRSAFGTVRLSGPRLHYCSCESTDGGSFGLLSGLFTGRTAPELLYLESRWASLMSYGLTADLLADVLPVGTTANPSSIRNQVQRVARRCDAEIATERHSFIDGCPADWGKLPVPEGPIVVGVDGGYVRQWDDKKSNFEMIVGKSVPEDRDQRYFGFVQTIDDKPRSRLFEILRSQGLQMNQDITFLSDGGESLRNVVTGLSPCAEFHLDWFHITMRITVLGQYIKGLAHHDAKAAETLTADLDRIKWLLWNGAAREARMRITDLADDVSGLENNYPNLRAFAKATAEFVTYIANNLDLIPNYGERWRNDEPISTAFVESTVNVVVDKRFTKKQQMQWSRLGAHRLLQIRTRTLDGTLRRTFRKWYPGMKEPTEIFAA